MFRGPYFLLFSFLFFPSDLNDFPSYFLYLTFLVKYELLTKSPSQKPLGAIYHHRGALIINATETSQLVMRSSLASQEPFNVHVSSRWPFRNQGRHTDLGYPRKSPGKWVAGMAKLMKSSNNRIA
uniref:Secreted protein n=1 Tax=Rhizophora mucronata TaxID=61149 RepID=A0A2P2LG82_RHIMU